MNVTLSQVAAVCGALGAITALVVPPLTFIYRLLRRVDRRLDELERQTARHRVEINRSLSEQEILLKGIRACLDGLQQKGCNGRVSGMLEELDGYLLTRAHRPLSRHGADELQ